MKHGGNKNQAAAVYGLQPTEMIDLSTGISPRAYPLDLSQLALSDLIELPQANDAQNLEKVMRDAWQIPDSASLALAPGSGAVISLIPHLCPTEIGQAECRLVYCPEPVYSEHQIAWQRAGFELISYPAGTIPKINSEKTAAVIAVQPGNPMGHCADVQDWLGLMDIATANNIMLVIDEAFIDLMPEKSLVPHLGQKGVVAIRSLGKFYGLAGLRLGAAIGHHDDMTALEALMGPWAVSTMALRFGADAISDHGWADDQRAWLTARMDFLKDGLTQRGITIIGGTDLYCLIEIADAQRLQDGLARQGFWTRIFEYNPRWMRLGLAQDDATMARFLAALDQSQDNA